MWANKTLWTAGSLLLLMLAVAIGAYRAGHLKATQQGKAELTALQAQHHATALAAERDYAAKLQQVAAEKQQWYDFAQAQSVKLAQAQQTLDAQAQQIKQEIPHAIQADASHCAGLGTHSLRLYQRAFGYPD